MKKNITIILSLTILAFFEISMMYTCGLYAIFIHIASICLCCFIVVILNLIFTRIKFRRLVKDMKSFKNEYDSFGEFALNASEQMKNEKDISNHLNDYCKKNIKNTPENSQN